MVVVRGGGIGLRGGQWRHAHELVRLRIAEILLGEVHRLDDRGHSALG